jgi:hypothetical protein
MEEGHFYNEQDLIEACKRGHVDAVHQILQDKRVSRESDNSACLYWACHNGHADVVSALLWDDEVDASADESGALCAAAEFGHADIVRLLLDHQVADPAARRDSPIIRACKNGHAATVRVLLQNTHVNPAVNEGVCLYWACRRGHVDVLRILVNDGRVLAVQQRHRDDPYWPDKAFESACKHGHVKIVELFLDHTNIITRLGVWLACSRGHIDVVRTIINRSVPPHVIDPYIRRWIDTNIVTRPGSWLHGKYVARAHAIAWALRQMNQSDLAWDFVPYFMNARIQPVENWKEYVTQSPSCSLLPLFIVGICIVIGICLMIVITGAPPKQIQ